MDKTFSLSRRLVAEGLGTAFLAAIVIGSGIMGERLADGNAALALLGNTLATGAGLTVLILVFGAVSGAHFNPVVSLFFACQSMISWRNCIAYGAAQFAGGIFGAFLAHAMFDLPMLDVSAQARTGIGVWTGEIVATFGLLLTIIGCLKNKPESIPYAVGLFITAGYWFTSSTSFANPAITLARSLSDTFSGIRPEDVCAFMIAQLCGCLLAALVTKWLWMHRTTRAAT